MRHLASLAIVVLSSTTAISAEPASNSRLSAVEGETWAVRLRTAIGRDDWSVVFQRGEITIERQQPVMLANWLPNAPAGDQDVAERPTHEHAARFTLRFTRKMSLDEYDRLAAANAESTAKREQLHRKVGLPHKFDEFIATTPEEKERVRTYREAVAKLPYHELPNMYSTDRSILLSRSWHGWSSPVDKEVAAEIREVEGALQRYFGMYSPEAANENRQISVPELLPRR